MCERKCSSRVVVPLFVKQEGITHTLLHWRVVWNAFTHPSFLLLSLFPPSWRKFMLITMIVDGIRFRGQVQRFGTLWKSMHASSIHVSVSPWSDPNDYPQCVPCNTHVLQQPVEIFVSFRIHMMTASPADSDEALEGNEFSFLQRKKCAPLIPFGNLFSLLFPIFHHCVSPPDDGLFT